MFRKLFGKKPQSPPPVQPDEENLLIVPVPALVAVLIALEGEKGSPLTEAEVLKARDEAVSIVMPRDVMLAVEQRRGYRDLDPENIWGDWQAFRGSDEGRRAALGYAELTNKKAVPRDGLSSD